MASQTQVMAAAAALGVGVGIGGTTLIWWYGFRTNPNKAAQPQPRPTPTVAPNVPTAETLQKFIDARSSDGRRNYGAISAKPADSRLVPLVGLGAPTPLVSMDLDPSTREGTTQNIQKVKTLLAASGRGAEDPRCVYFLWDWETDGTRKAWQYSGANVKAASYIFADEALIQSGKVWSRSAYATCVWLAQGSQETRVEGYLGFPSWEVWCRFQKGNFMGSTLRSGVIAGYQEGGIEGLKKAERLLGTRPLYSSAIAATRVLRAERWWEKKQELVGLMPWEQLR